MSFGWLTQVTWESRDRTLFGSLRSFVEGARKIPAITVAPQSEPQWPTLRDSWRKLRGESAILEPLGIERETLVLRYAALCWNHAKLPAGLHHATLATWMLDLAHAYQVLSDQVSAAISHYCNPVAHIDMDDRVRIGFLPSAPVPAEMPYELRAGRAEWDERSIVFMAGTVASRLVHQGSGPADALIARCIEEKPRRRFQSVRELVDEIGSVFRIDPRQPRPRSAAYRRLEEGLGWLEMGNYREAEEAFMELEHVAEYQRPAAFYRGIATKARQAPRDLHRPFVIPTLAIQRADLLPRAREALRLGDIGFAASLAHELRKYEPDHREAAFIIAEAHFKNGRHDDALATLDHLAMVVDDASTQYQRAKMLFRVGRLQEAREGFERAYARDPSMLEAMLLRREVDRASASLRAHVGDATAQNIHVPDALADLRDVLLAGDITVAIAALQHPRYDRDAEAQLVLARFLVMDGQHERALEAYDRVTDGAHSFAALLGKATTLLALGRDESALALFDLLVAEKPGDAEASDGRARALEKLDRIGEAAAEYRRFISLATLGSDLRVRAAQAWLDAHPL